MKRLVSLTMFALAALVLAACQAQAPVTSPAATAPTQSASSAPAPTAASQSNPETPIESVASATVLVEGSPRFLEVSPGAAWVATPKKQAVVRIDTATNQVVAKVPIDKPCAAMAAGYDSIWVQNCGDGALYRIDAKTNEVIAKIPVALASSDGSITAGEGGVWVPNGDGVLSRIDPATNKVVAQIPVKPLSYMAAAGYGGVWVTNYQDGSVQRVDPKSNQVVATIPVGLQPNPLTVGEDGVWVLNQSDGTVSRIDPVTNKVVATIEAGVPYTGSRIAAGEGSVWVTGPNTLLSVIDPKTNQVAMRYGPKQGSGDRGDLRAGEGSVWISSANASKVWRLDPAR
jgi:virginiamycin B lyase